ncbi:MAG TPA: CmcJ/NvfI family oxidoreductase [Steroidobacteraceae bacterium]|jgi:hypothetical protein|nr:CmcJ/NvfI family oxidoreductase [Steroidobacteraceae bacterium]
MTGVATIQAQINYLAPGSHINRRFVAPGREVNTGEYRPYTVTIGNARPQRADFTLDTHGFMLTSHHSAVQDFLDKDEVNAVYPAEVAAVIRGITGADRIATMGWMARTSGDLSRFAREEVGYRHQGGVQPPAGEAHVDSSPDRVDRMAQGLYQQRFAGDPPYARYLYMSFWRAFSSPPQDYPLALCDGNSVGDDEGVPNTMYVVDKIPEREEMLRPMPEEDTAIAAAIFHFSPHHRWWYFPDMMREEALLFVFHDSRRIRPWRVPHTAFFDGTRRDVRPRDSIELRSVAYFF